MNSNSSGSSNNQEIKKDLLINVDIQYQYPSLPTGCEVTSVSMLLKHCCKGDDNDQDRYSKEVLAEQVGKEQDPCQDHISLVGGNPYRAFVGLPTSKLSFGMFHQPVYHLIDNQFNNSNDNNNNNNNSNSLKAIDLTDKCNDLANIKYPLKLNESEEYIKSRLDHFETETTSGSDDDDDESDIEILKNHLNKYNYPIIIWMTLELRKPSITDTWIDVNVPENEIHWVSPEHCALLVGYNENEFIINDPHTGKVEYYNKDLFLKRWRQMGRQAVSIIQ
ncbi:hypothetical protein PPL_07261 [Heterostelium album PN500]|uniref:Peptidase C39-like domain-containing protein n=1 Tax=Heterostelium pallidum (strain ATCC 26659 / Pp 5 / PN500) TaxID=670386 RepID=D3BEU6_HETP5|nr:hypothetical protein PPL_07261 [Heterostelium album PN500]EFA80427.1 hypothetical protein PPL_07261 [Heterostelium album PN500]|eukprot:XP_020432547.1 hypothetical protein PPL_07261 [Heterostelium album PN500]